MSAARFRSLVARAEVFDLLLLSRPKWARFAMFLKFSKMVPDAEIEKLFAAADLDEMESAVAELETNVKGITDQLS